MADERHMFRGELVLFDEVTRIFGFEEDEDSSFLHMERERLQDEYDGVFGKSSQSSVRFDLSGNRLHITVSTSATINRLEIVKHIQLLTGSLIRVWEWVLINYDSPDASTLMQIKNVSYVES